MTWWQRRIHPTWQLTMCCGGIVGGVALAQWWPYTGWWWLVVAGGGIACALHQSRRWCLILILIAGLIVGLVRGGSDQQQQRSYAALFGHVATITGQVQDDPDTNQRNQLVVRLGAIRLNGRSLPGTVWVSLHGNPAARRSDWLVVRGKLKPGFGNFAAVMQRAHVEHIVKPQPGDVALQVRDWFAEHIRHAIHEPAASLGSGYVLGQKRALPHDIQEAMRTTGLTHIVVASGYNLTILVRLARRLFAKVSRYLAVLTSASLVLGFVAITGLSPSMTRAGLVAGLSIWAWAYGRAFHPITLLAVASAATVLWNPSYVWGDIGWQLSFASFAGVMILAPLLQRYFFGPAEPSIGRQVLGETVSAQLATLPISLAAFGQLSLVALPANLLIVPWVPLAMLLTCIAGVGALVWPSAATVFGAPAQWLLDAMLWVVQQCAAFPWAQLDFTLPWWGVALWYGGLISLCWWLWRATDYSLRDASLIE